MKDQRQPHPPSISRRESEKQSFLTEKISSSPFFFRVSAPSRETILFPAQEKLVAEKPAPRKNRHFP